MSCTQMFHIQHLAARRDSSNPPPPFKTQSPWILNLREGGSLPCLRRPMLSVGSPKRGARVPCTPPVGFLYINDVQYTSGEGLYCCFEYLTLITLFSFHRSSRPLVLAYKPFSLSLASYSRQFERQDKSF